MLVLSNIHKSFNKGKNNEISVLKGISLSFADTGLYAILGPSGSGKSTLLSLIGGLDKPDTGTILFNNLDITRLSEKEMNLFNGTFTCSKTILNRNIITGNKMFLLKDKYSISKARDNIL